MSEEKVMRIEEVEGMLRRVLDEQNEKSLRDYFAGLAMQAFLHSMSRRDEKTISAWAYCQADAMLKERENHE